MMYTDREIRSYILRFVGRCVGVIAALWLVCYCIDVSTRQPPIKVSPPEEVWKGYDPSRPVTDIESLDYENMRVAYRRYLKSGEQLPPLKIYGGQNDSGLTDEEVFERLNLEYEDLYEYLMD